MEKSKGYVAFGVYAEAEINLSVWDQLDRIHLDYLGKASSLEEVEKAIADDIMEHNFEDDLSRSSLEKKIKKARVAKKNGLVEYEIELDSDEEVAYKAHYMVIEI